MTACVVALLLVVGAFASTVARADDKPNFVVILTDDQGYADLGCFGSPTIHTPNIDRMARGGVRLTSFYAAAPICTPTRAALMTGCYATRVGLPTPLHVFDEIGLNPAEVTLPEVLQQRGYRTACVGKWHLGHAPAFYPTRHGFDVYWGTPLGHMFDRPAVGKAVGDTSDLFLDNETAIAFPDHGDLTERLTDVAVRFIAENKRRPFFLFVSHPMPHEPLAVSPRFAGKSKGGLYGDVIECIDWSTGRILAALEEHGLTERTVVIFTSDNGPKKGHGSAAPLRGFKHQPYEGGVRVPCVAYAPGRIPAGRTVDAITTVMDLYPTLAGLAGAPVSPQQVRDGRDIWPLLTGESNAEPAHREFFYFVRHGVLAGVRDERWKLLEQKGLTELFDLVADISESSNVAGQHPEIVARLTARMQAFEKDVTETKRPPAGAKATTHVSNGQQHQEQRQ
ncbi:MAG: sulfatase-like hydrolase/transferase [Phycisphaera sp.]|nr:sulfatase-like hydrolase/transferase [Phycisphaera sp.]